MNPIEAAIASQKKKKQQQEETAMMAVPEAPEADKESRYGRRFPREARKLKMDDGDKSVASSKGSSGSRFGRKFPT